MLLPSLLVSPLPYGMVKHFLLRVASTWEPNRLQRGPHTGRGAKPVGLVDDRTRSYFSATLGLMPPSLIAFILIFFAGAFLRSMNILNKSHAERLASIVFSVSLPATILVSLDGVLFAPTAWKLPAAAVLVTLPMIFIAFHLARS